MPERQEAPSHTSGFWAKSAPRQEYPKRTHLLEHHLTDVGACFEAVLARPTIRYRLARSGGLHDIDDVMRGRLARLAALHDIGKCFVLVFLWGGCPFPLHSDQSPSSNPPIPN